MFRLKRTIQEGNSTKLQDKYQFSGDVKYFRDGQRRSHPDGSFGGECEAARVIPALPALLV